MSSLLGAEHPTVALALSYLAHCYHEQGKLEQAEALVVRALSIKEKHFGTNHSAITMYLNQLASLYTFQGKFEQAELLYLQAINGFEQLQVADVLRFFVAVHGFAGLLEKQSKFEQAAASVQHAISIVEHRLEATHERSHKSKRLLVDHFHGILHRIASNAEQALDVTDAQSV